MRRRHVGLTEEKWAELSLAEQLANVGAEVGRAIRWKEKGNQDYGQEAFLRSLELIDLTLATTTSSSCLREVARTRELLVDYFWGSNEYSSTASQWQKYFAPFNYRAGMSRAR